MAPSISLSQIVRASVVAMAATIFFACGDEPIPTQPAPPPPPPPPPAVTISSVTVGVAGSLPATLAPGERLQLFAQATQSDNSVLDVTNTAVWQSSNPSLATVSSGGVLMAFAEGAVDVSATYQSRAGSLRADIVRLGCRATVTPSSLSFGALAASSIVVTVTTSLSDCRWTVRSNVPWLPLSFDPGRSGNGSFYYSIPGNNTTDARDAELVVSISGGPPAVHRIHQERPVGCVYTVSPRAHNVGVQGGTQTVQVTTVPADCQWRATTDAFEVSSLSPPGGVGAATVTYTVPPNVFSSSHDHTLSISGLSGLNPPAVHTIRLVK